MCGGVGLRSERRRLSNVRASSNRYLSWTVVDIQRVICRRYYCPAGYRHSSSETIQASQRYRRGSRKTRTETDGRWTYSETEIIDSNTELNSASQSVRIAQ